MSGALTVLARPVGPMPLGAWLVVGVGGLGIAWYRGRSQPISPDSSSGDGAGVPVLSGDVAATDGAPVVITPIVHVPVSITAPPVAISPAPAPITTVPGPRPAPARTATLARRTYTVTPGDTLWAIAGKTGYGSAQWRRIYAANAAVIDRTARAHGKSGGGHWIFPGTVLVLP